MVAPSCQDRTPSLCSTLYIACVVQNAKQRFKSLISSPRSPAAKSKFGDLTELTGEASWSCQRVLNHQNEDIEGDDPKRWCGRRNTLQIQTARLLHESAATVGSQEVSLANVASDDHLFLKYDASQALQGKCRTQLATVLDSCTYALKCLKVPPGSHSRCSGRQLKTLAWHTQSFCANALANLMHILLCLQQAAIRFLVLLSFTVLEAEILRRRGYWEQVTRFEMGRFSEWPSGQRPLSTSWPWNIRPSLVILWGVCWMFYDYNDQGRKQSQTAGEISDASIWGGIAAPQQSQSHSGQITPAAAWTGFINNSVASNIAPVPQLESRREAGTPGYYQVPGLQPYTPGNASNQYIGLGLDTASESLTGSLLSQSWPYQSHLTTSLQQYDPNIGPGQQPLYSSNPLVSVPQDNPTRSLGTAANYGQEYQPAVISAPYTVVPSQPTNRERQQLGLPPFLPPNAPKKSVRRSSSVQAVPTRELFNPDLGAAGSDMQNYPSPPSPHSEVSDLKPPMQSFFPGLSLIQQHSHYRPSAPATSASPPITYASSSAAQISSPPSHTSGTPNLNPFGQMQCPHPQCSLSPKIFSRKSDYQKHMDKHVRPYLCEEPECRAKRLAFTYSGGLTRHQKEVHGRLGGAKGKCWCPHAGCKRNTGVGFSRKENLTEHLRRVHRGVPSAEDIETPASPAAATAETGRKRHCPQDESVIPEKSGSRNTSSINQKRTKRRRRFIEVEDVTDDDDDEGSLVSGSATDVPEKGRLSLLQKQVSRLKRDMKDKEDRLRILEEKVKKLSADA